MITRDACCKQRKRFALECSAIRSTLSRRWFRPVKQYQLDGRLKLTANAFNKLRYVSSLAKGAHCYAKLDVSSPAVSGTIASTRCTRNGSAEWPGLILERNTLQRSPVPILIGLDVAELGCRCDQRHCHCAKLAAACWTGNYSEHRHSANTGRPGWSARCIWHRYWWPVI